MTIFLMVLTKLIKKQLNHTVTELTGQAEYPSVYNQLLSLQKKNILEILESKISKVESSGNDENDANAIVKLLEAHRVQIQEKQEEHGKSRDTGETLTTISNLMFHTNSFYTKLAGFVTKKEVTDKLSLINKTYTNNPEDVIYYHSVYYVGEEVFNPSSSKDVAIRNAKEEAICDRIQSLSERIKPEFSLLERRSRALDILKDLATDNQNIINPKKSSGFSLPFFSLGGVVSLKVPKDWFNPSEGRFGQQFSIAHSIIRDMVPAKAVAKPPVVEESKEPELPAKHVVKPPVVEAEEEKEAEDIDAPSV
jgi:hypothetical protein